uniref:3'(2'),5'-bisphosphate nucleotidase 1 n=1 Tax=Arcella intermedia TaxID=1963864 RepID=A0A6B2LBJ8_9EUKA
MLSGLYHLADQTALLARKLVLSGDLVIKEKNGPMDLLTNVDVANQAFIVGNLLKTWPNLHIIGEEDQNVVHQFEEIQVNRETLKKEIPKSLVCPIDDIIVYIDPIDGTKEFTEGVFSQVTILIGISFKGTPIAGIVCQPWREDSKDAQRGVFLWGLVDHGVSPIDPSLFGSKLLSLPSQPSYPSPQSQNLTLAITRSRSTPELEALVQKHQFKDVLRVGGCGYKILLLILEKADVYIQANPGTNRWDTCGPEAILRAAGGRLTDLSGKDYRYVQGNVRNEEGVIALRKNVKFDI